MYYMTELCHIWVSHVTYECVMSQTNKSCHIWMSNVACEWVMSRTNESCHIRVGPSPNGLPASCFRNMWEIWDGKRNAFFSPSRIVTFLPVQKSFVPAVPKCDVFREGCDNKRHKLKKNSCARASHSSQKCDKCDASHFLSPKKVTNVTSLTQIWDGKLGGNPVRTDPKSCDI